MSTKCDNLDCCPVCGHTPIDIEWDDADGTLKEKCYRCGWNKFRRIETEKKENCYDDFANEMYKLRYSLYKAGFRDKDKEERAHILGGMAATIYNRTETDKARKIVESMPGLDGKPGSGGLGGSGWR